VNTIREFKRKVFIAIAFPRQPKIVIASTGRAGSTMLYDAVADSLIKHKFHLRPHGMFARMIKRWCSNFVLRISSLSKETSLVCKTHDIFESPPDFECKYIFLYADPLESAKSVGQFDPAGFSRHQFHLRGSGDFSELYRKDVLNYQGQLESWLTQVREDIICIDYNDLWDEKKRLSKFLGFDVELPPRRSRKPKAENTNINTGLFMQLRELKHRLKVQYLSSLSP
jgi:hypothetical protein